MHLHPLLAPRCYIHLNIARVRVIFTLPYFNSDLFHSSLFSLVAETTDLFDATENMMAFFMLFHIVGVSSVCTNPVLYGFLNENFKKVVFVPCCQMNIKN